MLPPQPREYHLGGNEYFKASVNFNGGANPRDDSGSSEPAAQFLFN
jgi:hypothetical protein